MDIGIVDREFLDPQGNPLARFLVSVTKQGTDNIPVRIYSEDGKLLSATGHVLTGADGRAVFWAQKAVSMRLRLTPVGSNLEFAIMSDVYAGEAYTQGGGGGGGNTATTVDVTSLVTAGAIVPGDVVPSGSNLQDVVEQLLLTTFYPTFVAPSFSLSSNVSASIELGTIMTVNLTASFNRGQIKGTLSGSVWDANAVQNFRAGAVDNYVIAGTNTGASSSLSISNYQIVEGSNAWSATANYSLGPQPLDSKGLPYGTPLPAGSLIASTSATGRRRAFYGSNSGTTSPVATSAEVRALTNSLLGPSNGSSFTINIPIGTSRVTFGYPATLQNVSSVKYVEGLNAEVKGIFTQTTVSVAGANGYSPVNYKIYTYVPATPFTAIATYNVTI